MTENKNFPLPSGGPAYPTYPKGFSQGMTLTTLCCTNTQQAVAPPPSAQEERRNEVLVLHDPCHMALAYRAMVCVA
jgi:hypothetical protein